MRNRKKLVSLILTAVMILSLAVPAFANGGTEETVYSAVVRFEDHMDADDVCRELEQIPGVNVRWMYTELFRGAAVEGSAAALTLIENCSGIKLLARSRMWARPYAEGDAAGITNSLDVMRGEDLRYNGDGVVVAVIDSGFYVGHEVFQDYGIIENPALSEEEIDAFAEEHHADGRYISPKIPFAYDYCDQDRSVHTMDSHGTHVAALAAGYAKNEDGTDKFRGVAGAAQLLCMKVFPDDANKGASDADILKAMEDALLLGADIINLSLGAEGDFMEGDEIGTLYQKAIRTLREAGVIVCCASGNEGHALSDKDTSVEEPTADYTDFGTASIPAAFPGAIGVGAVNSLIREGGGGIVVNGVTIGLVKGASENEEEVLPDMDQLAEQELTYVMVGGLGAKSDFEGLDLTGCVAVVKRGEISFAEKVNNAAAAGAVACVIYNNESGAVTPSVTGTTIPCALILQEAGEYLAEQAEDGRGTMTIKPDKEMVNTGEPLSMLYASSWGPTSDLRLLSKLCAPGGMILSAVTGGTDTYGYLSGTSMAAPNASGAFAVLLQALTERGITGKTERAKIAEDLLMSTALLVTDEDGTPISPRRQGAGVIDLAAALESRALVISPVLELGDGMKDTFRLTFTLKNISEENLRFTVDAKVLTDLFDTMDDQTYNMLTPLEITKYMKVNAPSVVEVQAGGEKAVSLSVSADRALIEMLEEVYHYGFFLEGYITLTEERGDTVHVTFMGYHGDWEAAPVIEQVDLRDVMNAVSTGAMEDDLLDIVLGVNMGYNLVYLLGGTPGNEQLLMPGQNPYASVAACDDRFAMSTVNSDAHAIAGYSFDIDLYTLRHAAHVIMVVSDRKTGEIYYVDDTPNLPRAKFNKETGGALNSGWFFWDGTDSRGEALKDGTVVDVEFFAWTESDTAMQSVYAAKTSDMTRPDSYRWLLSGSYDDRREWMFPLTLDGTSPAVIAERAEETGDIRLTVTEEEFLAYAMVQNSMGEILLAETYEDETRGKDHVLTVTLPEGETAPVLYITLMDYAANTIGYRIDLSDMTATTAVSRCPMALFEDVQKNAWYHDAIDFIYENKLMDTTDVRTFAPDVPATRAVVMEVLYRLAGEPEMETISLPFTDVKGNEWYADALMWAYQLGIANGYSEEMFGGFAAISRQQLATMLYRAAKLGGKVSQYDESVLDRFADNAEISGWAREAMVWAVGEGIFTGDNMGNLCPTAAATRAQLAQIIMNILKEN